MPPAASSSPTPRRPRTRRGSCSSPSRGGAGALRRGRQAPRTPARRGARHLPGREHRALRGDRAAERLVGSTSRSAATSPSTTTSPGSASATSSMSTTGSTRPTPAPCPRSPSGSSPVRALTSSSTTAPTGTSPRAPLSMCCSLAFSGGIYVIEDWPWAHSPVGADDIKGLPATHRVPLTRSLELRPPSRHRR